MEKVKCVLLGDQSVGKTSLISSYFQQKIAAEYTPTILEVFEIQSSLSVGESDLQVLINLWDTPGDKGKYEDFQGLIHQGANIFIICFSLVDKNSLRNALKFWYNDQLVGVKQHLHQPNTEVVFIGCQKDLKDIYLYDQKHSLVVQQADRIFQRMGVQYYEICALTQDNLASTFNDIFNRFYCKVMQVPSREPQNQEEEVVAEFPKKQQKKCLLF